MKQLILRLTLTILCSAGIMTCQADIVETTTSSAPTEYCVEQTSVRGEFDALVIDHHLIIPPADQFKQADVFVAARFKSKPGDLWLLRSNYQWRKINSKADLLLANYREYVELPLIIPISVSYLPIDVSYAIGDLEIWMGYGFRSASENAQQSFDEMARSHRYEMVWEALPPHYSPADGRKDLFATICMTTTAVRRTIPAGTAD